MRKNFSIVACALFVVAMFGYGCKGGGSSAQEFDSGECSDKGWCGEQAVTITANISGAEALFTQAESGSVVGSLSAEKSVTVSTASPLFSVTTSGIVGVLAAAYDDASDALGDLPKLSFVAVSPVGHVVLVFEHPFIYTETSEAGEALDEYSDPWREGSPFTCQVFVVNQKINASGLDASNPPGLTCITNDLVLNTWDFRAAMVQFDGSGGVYFTAHVPQNWKNVLVKWTPGTDDSGTGADESVNGTLSEVINANICFREYLVTNEGGVLYTGITSTSGDCSGTSFLRYRTPAGALQEITSGWWEYVFQPIETTLFPPSANIAKDITSANIGEIVFYGPDPELATTPEWDDACLYKFDPDASGTARSVQIADCDIDIWRYVDWADTNADKRTRCTEVKSMMGGGNIPTKILLADLNADATNFEIYVVGDIYEKKEGEWRCDLCINDKGTTPGIANYCSASGNLHFEATTAGTCAAVDDDGDGTADGTWGSAQNCFNQQVQSTSTGNICTAANADDFDINGQWCQQPGGDWREVYSALAWVIYDDNDTTNEADDTKQIVRISDNDEIVRNAWVVDDQLVYSSFNSTDGEYKLRQVVWTDTDSGNDVDTTDGADADAVPDEITKTDLMDGIEVYELMADPRSNHSDEWFFNGLRFSDNSYVTGTFNPTAADPSATLATEAGITGQIETLVIVPEL